MKSLLKMVALTGLAIVCGGIGQSKAMPIGSGAFGPTAVVESFEGLSVSPNLVNPFDGFLNPGVLGPFTFASGVTLTEPIPNVSGNAVLLIGDFALGSASFGLGTNGVVLASTVPFGSAYMGLNTTGRFIEFTFSSDMIRVGAFVTADQSFTEPPRPPITISAFDASGALLETTSVPRVDVSQWGSNFLGIEDISGIRRIRFQTEVLTTGGSLVPGPFVLDGLTFEASAAPIIPESSTMLLLGSGLAGLFAWRMKKAKA